MSHIDEEFQRIEREHGWTTLFRKLANDHGVRTLEKKNDIALSSINRGLNRFRDVLPYDDTRVRLQRGSNDYINANFVQVSSANRNYILTQGPLPKTSEHFWQMVWEQNSRVIVMLTRLVEKGCNKCWLYYPDYENESELYFEEVDLKVSFVSEKQEEYYTQRKFELTNLLTGETRPIIHWSDFDWPDHGAPSTSEPFLQLLSDVRHCGAFDSRFGPPVLHCSAGKLAHTENPEKISLIEVLAHIRTQRHGLIQTAEQLRFSYMAIVAGLKELDELEQSEDLFNESDFDASSESDNENDSKLSTSLENIKYELKKRAEKTANTSHSLETKNDAETSVRLREERLKRNEGLRKKIDEIKSKLDDKSSLLNNNNNPSILSLLMTRYRRHFFIGLLTLFTGSIFLYKFVRTNDRAH
ncbi:unnamed protein product [Rotaria magnacalcarata]|uniref:protein-tyrosine-phosphatase n=1 Tax=Rotaria magnacalcarata TaxID=392030 RepID=A0A819RLT6_9BILA|nr:unnamed protein product [Rotaria magnacalcarata]CAF3871646.1 unnamed protein product [Rotaria magnacalcarata]CAF3969920.1 unnamed protein product [Rotaria magnacalcarata]CAF4048219.1 unnamed protein product [Rotaria magnacalcarata]CAF4290476.1 unnamed protein product [Rotaria magnacalcarata]